MKMIVIIAILGIIIGCGAPKEEAQYISAVGIIKADVEHVDTSLYAITQYTTVEGSSVVDTAYISRENFSQAAADFLALPDIADKKNKKKFTEESHYDNFLGKVILTYLPKKADSENIKRQELVITPDITGGESPVSTIIIDYSLANKDSSLHKKMLWQVNKSFQITKILKKPGGFEKVTTTKVIWNEPTF